MVHISELAPGRVNEVTDVLDVGDEVDVKVIEIDQMGRVNLSKVQADLDLGRVDASEVEEKRGGRDGGGRGGRGGDRDVVAAVDRGGRGGGRDRGGRGGGGRDRR